ncbi:MAG: NrfD/PsrC family molybdoenzyme membrane anchor subunit [Terriglobales bacterium]
MKEIEWGFLIVNYLFLGGLSAGLFFVSALATLMQRNGNTPHYTRIARYGAFLAPWPVMLGCVLLIFDLGKWYRFYKLFLHFRWASPMSIGSWLLILFNVVSLVYLFAWLNAEERASLFARLPRRLAFLNGYNHDLSSWLRPLAMAALPLSIGVGIYTGVLLGAVQSRPFWNTNLVAQLFLVSALSTGCALLIFVLVVTCHDMDFGGVRLLCALDIFFLALEFFIVVPYIIHGQLSTRAVQESLLLILGGPFTLLFWVFFLALGVLLPLAIEIREILPSLLGRASGHCSRWLAATTAALVLGGGFVLRVIFVYAGQMSAFN